MQAQGGKILYGGNVLTGKPIPGKSGALYEGNFVEP
jgi:hypothetical protein